MAIFHQLSRSPKPILSHQARSSGLGIVTAMPQSAKGRVCQGTQPCIMFSAVFKACHYCNVTKQQDSVDTMQSAAERSWQEWKSQKHANVLTTPKTSNDEREMERAVGNSHPAQAVPEIRCVKCDATRTQLATHGDPGPCCNPFLTCSYEELWRSLPCGEDR